MKIIFKEDLAIISAGVRRMPQLVAVSKAKYTRLRNINVDGQKNTLYPGKLNKIIPPPENKRLRASVSLMARYSTRLFPAFRFMAKEFVTTEWLSFVDFHKKFHRDHIFHQTQVAYTVNELLEKLKFEVISHRLAAKFVSWANVNRQGENISLLELCAYRLGVLIRQPSYLNHFVRQLGIPSYLFNVEKNPHALELLKTIVYNSALTAAFYHDIGYPFQFLVNIEKTLDPLTKFDLLTGYNPRDIFNAFKNRLFMTVLSGYRNFNDYPTPSDFPQIIEENLEYGLKITHGLPGAITFLHLNDSLRDYQVKNENPINLLIMELAAAAIMMHDMQKIYGNPVARPHLRLSFSRDPISFVVTLADQIQEYGRISGEPATPSNSTTVIKFNIEKPVREVELEYNEGNNGVEISYIYEDSTKGRMAYYEKKKVFIPITMSDYFDERNGFLDYSEIFSKIKLEAKYR